MGGVERRQGRRKRERERGERERERERPDIHPARQDSSDGNPDESLTNYVLFHNHTRHLPLSVRDRKSIKPTEGVTYRQATLS